MINFKQLEAIYWLRELHSFQKVADRIHKTQPAVSARISSLEEVIGSRLVDRLPTGIKLTSLGREVADHAERLILQRNVMLEDVRRDSKASLRIACVGQVMQTWGPYLRNRLQVDAPHLSVEFSFGTNIQIESDIRSGAADLAFMTLNPTKTLLSTYFSVEYDIGWFGATEFVKNLPKPATPSDLGSCDLVLFPPTSPLFSPMTDAMSNMSGPRHFANSLPSILTMLKLGYGISAIPVSVALDDIETGDLAQITTVEKLRPLIVYCAHVSQQKKKQAAIVLEIAELAAQDFAMQPNSAMKYVPGQTPTGEICSS
jgi:DNA-binding transcriptional LysR family regulator